MNKEEVHELAKQGYNTRLLAPKHGDASGAVDGLGGFWVSLIG